MPIYLAQNGYKNPLDPSNGIFQYTKGFKGDMFHYYVSHPVEGESFNHVMGGVMANQAGWVDIFPHETLLDSDVDSNSPLVVDVGGNIGHDIEKFRQKNPDTAPRLYLEDRPEVVKHSKCPEPVNKIGYDFFTPQPIKGKTSSCKVTEKIKMSCKQERALNPHKKQERAPTTCTASCTTGPTSPPARSSKCKKGP